MQFLDQFCAKIVPIGAELEQSSWTILKHEVLTTSHKKGSMISATDWKKQMF